MNPRRLYRCRHDRQLAGVAAGMAEYLGLDPTLVRVLWVLSVLFGGVTILLYVILAFVMPLEPAAEAPASVDASAGVPFDAAGAEAAAADATSVVPPTWSGHRHETRRDGRPDDGRPGRAGIVAGVVLVVFGAVALVDQLLPGWAAGAMVWPALLVALGVALLVGATRRPAPAQ